MAYQNCPGIYEVRILGATDRGPVVNVLHGANDNGFSVAQLEAIAEGVWDDFAAGVLLQLANQYSLTEVRVTDLSTSNGIQGAYAGPPVAGGTSGQALPFDSALCVTLRTGYRGRSSRGRIYLGPLAESGAENGVALPAVVTQVVDGVEAVLQGLRDVQLTPVVLSRRSEKAVRPIGVGTEITSVVVRSAILASQARRSHRP